MMTLDDDLCLVVHQGEQVHAVGLVVLSFAVALAFQETLDFDAFAKEGGEEAFQDIEIGLVAQQAFHRPVEADVVFGSLFHGGAGLRE